MNEYLNLTLDNLDDEHLCCALGDPKHQAGVDCKKDWLKARIKEGHVFRKLNARGKIFIEYAPLEKAWVPVTGQNYLYIYCLWVAGSFKGQGHGQELLQYAIADAKKQGKNGLCVLSSKKKKPFLAEKSFFTKYGFQVVDTINDYELLAVSFNQELPHFNDCVKKMTIEEKDLTLFYSPQCPFTVFSVNEAKRYMEQNHVKINLVCIDSLDKAKNVPCIFNNFAVFNDGKFVSNTLLNLNSFAKIYQRKAS